MNRQELITKLKQEYALKRKRAQLLAEKNKQRSYEIKESYELELKSRQLILDIAKLNFENKNSKKLEQELKKVTQNKLVVLKNNNIDPESLDVKYDCAICKDTGLVNGYYCSCFNQALNYELMKDSKINLDNLPSLKNYELKIFNTKTKEQLRKILTLSQKFVDAFPNTKTKNIIFSGETGVGKTYLSKVLAKEIIKKGYTAYYSTAFSLNNLMLKYHTTFTDEKAGMLDTVLNSDLLIIDDLGTEPVLRNVTIEYLLLIINERLQNKKSTIITTNLGPQNIIDRYGERIFSRLMNKQNSLLINIDGIDLRLKKDLAS